MMIAKKTFLVAVAVTSLMAGVPALAAATVVDVSLWEHPNAEMATGLGYAMGGDPAGATMGITVSASNVPAGDVTFDVFNDGPDMIHEMVVSPVTEGTPLPYDATLDKVLEDDAGHLGEVAELEPGQKGSLTLEMRPGHYILYCNIEGHYASGMWTLLTVE